MIFETHAHYDDKAFDNDLQEMLKKIEDSNVKYVVDVASTMKSIDKILDRLPIADSIKVHIIRQLENPPKEPNLLNLSKLDNESSNVLKMLPLKTPKGCR